MSDPFRARRIPPDEVRRIVRRASDLAAIDAAAQDAGPPLTEAELSQKLTELGISKEIVDRAMKPIEPSAQEAGDGAVRVVREIEIEGMLPPERHEEIADVISAAMKMQGRVSAVGNKLTWVPSGILTEPTMTVHSKDGRTRIRYVETISNRGQATLGFATLGGFAGIIAGGLGMGGAVAIAKAAEITSAQGGPAVIAASVAIGVGAAVASFFGLRKAAKSRAEARAAFAEEVVARVVTAARNAIADEKKARVAPSLRVEAADAGEAEREAEAAAETSEGEGQSMERGT